MMKYQEPEMDIVILEEVRTITDSNLYTPENENIGGNEGGGQLDWDEL